jgi:hypothetical protein
MTAVDNPDLKFSPASPPVAAFLRARRATPYTRNAGPLLLYLLIAMTILWPYRTHGYRPNGDLSVVMALTADASYALGEGQFPIRVPPHLEDGLRYPMYQYYGVFPYTMTGAVSCVFGIGPYVAWKWCTLFSFIVAGFFSLQLAYALARHYRASVLAGVVFMTAPYLMTDLYARGAFAEMIAFNLLPVTFYFTLKCFRSRRRPYIPLCAISWALIGMAHNITYLYGIAFAALFFLPMVVARFCPSRVLRLICAGSLHALLMAWYLVPQFLTVPLLAVRSGIATPHVAAALTRLPILLAPVLTNSPEGQSTPNLGLQVGWPILAFALLGLAGLVLRRDGKASRRFTTIWLLILFSAACFMAWSPCDFWKYLPKAFWFVQFPYRLLMFVVLFGSMLTACTLAAWFRRRLPAWLTIGLLASLGLAVSSYLARPALLDNEYIARVVADPNIRSVSDYLPTPKALAATNWSDADPENMDWDARVKHLAAEEPARTPAVAALPMYRIRHFHAKLRCLFQADGPTLLELPALYYPGLLEVQDNQKTVPYGNAGRFVALRLAPGLHEIEVRFAGTGWANVLSVWAWATALVLSLASVRWRRLPRFVHERGWRVTPFGTAFSPKAALIGFTAFAACGVLPIVIPLFPLFHRPLHITSIASASVAKCGPECAFDGSPESAWVSPSSGPAVIKATFSHTANLHGVILEMRSTTLYEGYRRVGVILFKHGRQVYSGDSFFPRAAHERLEVINFPSTRADVVELHFSEAVTERMDGSQVSADMVNPGYAEIRFQFD